MRIRVEAGAAQQPLCTATSRSSPGPGSGGSGVTSLVNLSNEMVPCRILDLDDLDTRDAVTRDPATMIDGDQVVLIDEYQHAPVVLDAITAKLNASGHPGLFPLTGSARHEALPRAAQALTGRLTT